MRRSLVGITVAAAGLTLLTGDTTGANLNSAPRTGSGAAILRHELETMLASGIAKDHVKVRMLREDLAALEEGRETTAVTETGVDVAGMIAAADESRNDTSLMDDGAVTCEPIPGDVLTAAEIVGATCTNVVQPDGSSLYVAERPDGTLTAVFFGTDGRVTRLP